MDLFTQLEEINKQTPLAEILRPKTLDEFLGQSNVVAPNSPLLNLLKTQRLFSLILWGTPGCGKTTLARLIATKTNANFIEISAVTSGVKDIKDAVEKAKEGLRAGQKTILFIDEIHRYSKTQQDALLPHLENGTLFCDNWEVSNKEIVGYLYDNNCFENGIVPNYVKIGKPINLELSLSKLCNLGFYDTCETLDRINGATFELSNELNNIVLESSIDNLMRSLPFVDYIKVTEDDDKLFAILANNNK